MDNFIEQREKIKELRKDKKFVEAMNIAQEALNNDNITPAEKVKLQSHVIAIIAESKDEDKYKDIKRIAKDILRDKDITGKDRINFQKYLLDIIALLVFNKNYAEAKDVAVELLISPDLDTERRNKVIDLLMKKMPNEKRRDILRIFYKSGQYKSERDELYSGQMKIEDLELIKNSNDNTIVKCIFLAESYKYFRLENLGIQCIKDYRNNNITNINEQKAILKAMEILKGKNSLNVMPDKEREEWDYVYRTINIDKESEFSR